MVIIHSHMVDDMHEKIAEIKTDRWKTRHQDGIAIFIIKMKSWP